MFLVVHGVLEVCLKWNLVDSDNRKCIWMVLKHLVRKITLWDILIKNIRKSAYKKSISSWELKTWLFIYFLYQQQYHSEQNQLNIIYKKLFDWFIWIWLTNQWEFLLNVDLHVEWHHSAIDYLLKAFSLRLFLHWQITWLLLCIINFYKQSH